MMSPRLSGLQKEVLSLYRRILREAFKKDLSSSSAAAPKFVAFLQGKDQSSSTTSTKYAAQEFRRQAGSVSRSDFKRIEYMIRKGEKQVKLLQMPGVKVIGGAGSVSA